MHAINTWLRRLFASLLRPKTALVFGLVINAAFLTLLPLPALLVGAFTDSTPAEQIAFRFVGPGKLYQKHDLHVAGDM